MMMGTLPQTYNFGDYQDVTLSVTEECNLRCKYCYMVHKNTYKVMSLETAKKIVDFVLTQEPKRDAAVWNFIGGEPTLEMDLIDDITDYIKIRMYQLNHPWHKSHMFYIGTNGVLYGSDKLQRYILKNKNRVNIAITIDGTKEKHDLQRVHKDGSGSYDEIVKNIPLWIKQFPGQRFTKVTFASEDLCYLKESIIHLWEMGLVSIAANVVFEDVWKPGDEQIYEKQLKLLADYVIENQLWDSYSVRFFDPSTGFQLTKQDRTINYCGSGKMMAFDTEGNLYPCIRFLDFCLTSENGSGNACVGNYITGINQNKLRPFEKLSINAIDDEECKNCEIASGCATCSGMNYDDSGKRTIYHRAKYICKMQKAQIRANQYFWNRYSEVTGKISPYEHNRLVKYRGAGWKLPGLKYLYFILKDDITPHCNYTPTGNQQMPEEVFVKALAYANEKNMIPVFLGNPEQQFPGKTGRKINIKLLPLGEEVGERTELDQVIWISENHNTPEGILSTGSVMFLLEERDLDVIEQTLERAVSEWRCKYVNIIKKNFSSWTAEGIRKYTALLKKLKEKMKKSGTKCNLFENLQEQMDCKAGVESFAVAPNGYVYACPAFYYNDANNYICKVGEELPVRREFEQNYSPLCRECTNQHCRRCVFDHYIITGDVSTPSYRQCELAELEESI